METIHGQKDAKGVVGFMNHETGEITMAEEVERLCEITEIVDYMEKDLAYQQELVVTLANRLAPVLPEETPSTKDDGTMSTRITPLGSKLEDRHHAIRRTNRYLSRIIEDLEI